MLSSDDSGFWKLPWSGRQRRDAELRQRYAHAVEMMDAIRAHLQTQDEHAGHVSGAMQRVAGTLEQIAAAQQQQSAAVATISLRVESASRHAASIMATVVELPASLQAQAEAVRQVAKRMESSQSADGQLVASLQQFAHAVNDLRATGSTQTQTMQEIAGASDRHHETLRHAMREQNRRLLIVCGVTTCLTLAAMVGAVAIALFAR